MIVNLRQEVFSPCADFSSGRLRVPGAAARSPRRMDNSEVGERMLFRRGRWFVTYPRGLHQRLGNRFGVAVLFDKSLSRHNK